MIFSDSSKTRLYYSQSLSEWGKAQGISYKTAWRMFREGRLPQGIEGQRLPTGTIRIRELQVCPAKDLPNAVIYARINPRQKPSDLAEQVALCRSFCAARGWVISKTLQEVAPALGCRRRKLTRLLDPRPIDWLSQIRPF